MASFTKEQVELIEWLGQGNSLDVCIEICADLGKISGYETYNGHFQKRSLFRLKMQGFIAEKSHYVVGVHWQRVTLNQRGKTWLANNGGQYNA